MKKFTLIIVAIIASYFGYNKANHNFSVANITLQDWQPIAHLPHNSEDEIKQAKKILDQPFSYLGKGRQSFVFESKDGKYILKFIKCQRINVSNFYTDIPLPHFLDKKRKGKLYERTDRVKRLLTSWSLAKDPLDEQTGILLLHIEPRIELLQTVTLIDKLGFSHTLSIDSVPFILQEKAQQVMPVLKGLLKQNKDKELNTRFTQLIDLFIQRASLGIINPDSSLLKHGNIGFLKDRAIYIDLGTFKRSKKSASRDYLAKDLKKLLPIVKWLKKHDKQLANDFLFELNEAPKQYNPHI